MDLTPIEEELLEHAWSFRNRAYPHKSGTKVGCAILTDLSNIYGGWNIEGLWMTSIHAEKCAITNLTELQEKILIIAVVAETEKFTPCGDCLDWITQFATKECVVMTQNKHREVKTYTLAELMPNYPKN